MSTLNEQAAEEFIAARAFVPGLPGFVGIAVDLLVDPAAAPAGRRPLRHGFLDTRSPRVLVVSGPPSPGLEVALRRMGDDLAASTRVVEQHRLTVMQQATGTVHPEGPVSAIGSATAGIRLGLEAGLDRGGPFGLARRWRLAHTLAPVLAAAFANAPLRHGRPTGWRSVRQALRRDLPPIPPLLPAQDEAHGQEPDKTRGPAQNATHGQPPNKTHGPAQDEAHGTARVPRQAGALSDPRAAWAAYVLDTPGNTGISPRQRLRATGRITVAELERHMAGLRPPVAARGHLELDVA
ncbi:MAG TPA: glutamate-cysteine ligase family protein, partial [Actinoplanes sp.]|nr:glutamate-cysteine ligase family protein [Actinoplanes sp.]